MSEAKELQKWWLKQVNAFGLSFFFLIITAALGTFLRYIFVSPITWANYKHFLHAHSHLAFLGWVYNALFALILSYFIPRDKQKGLMRLFWITQIATVGMLIFFPIQGYARESIIFSTLHIFFSWAFAWMVWKRMHTNSTIAARYLKLALFFMVISSMGPFAMGPIMVNGLGGSNWYYMAIYYYLHFQYNGWFIFALLAMLYQSLESLGLPISNTAAARAFILFALGCIFSLSLSILWAEQQGWLYGLAALAGVMQLAGLFYLYRSVVPAKTGGWSGLTPFVKQLLIFAALAFLVKNVLQLFAALPALADMAFSNRNFIIAFLHLIFLGVVTPVLLAEGFHRRWLYASNASSMLIFFFLLAFVGSQLLLTTLCFPPLTAWIAPWYVKGLFLLSGLMFLTLMGVGISTLYSKR